MQEGLRGAELWGSCPATGAALVLMDPTRPAEDSSSLTPHPFSSGCYSQESHPWRTGTLLLWPKDTPNHHSHKTTPRAGEQPSSCFFQPQGSELWGTHGVCSSYGVCCPPSRLCTPCSRAGQRLGSRAEEKLLSWLLAKHCTARVSHILTRSILGSQMTSLPDDIP